MPFLATSSSQPRKCACFTTSKPKPIIHMEIAAVPFILPRPFLTGKVLPSETIYWFMSSNGTLASVITVHVHQSTCTLLSVLSTPRLNNKHLIRQNVDSVFVWWRCFYRRTRTIAESDNRSVGPFFYRFPGSCFHLHDGPSSERAEV